MKHDTESCKILNKAKLTDDIFDMTVYAPKLAPLTFPGQFAQILIPGKTLRRPISICGKTAETLRFVFQIRGDGTEILSKFEAGSTLDILAPLGKGFPVKEGGKRAVFVGGGIGVPPLLGAANAFNGEKIAVLGFKNKASVILAEDFKKAGCNVKIATDDGSFGTHGLVTDILKDLNFDTCFACGPAPMLRAAAKLCSEKNAKCWVSMEQRMACGVGACLGCAVKLKKADGTEYYGHVCKDGPVFSADETVL